MRGKTLNRTSFKRIQQLALLTLIITTVFMAVSFLPRTHAATTIFVVDPNSGPVGTVTRITANMSTVNGPYEIKYDGRLVFSGNASGNAVLQGITIPDASAGTHNITLIDINATETADSNFTIVTAYYVDIPVTTETIQENDTVPVRVNITGGNSSTTQTANIGVQAPNQLSYTKTTNLTLSTYGNGTTTVNYPTDFSTGANTSFVGNYVAFFNSTLANSTFTVGLTNATKYHRLQTVNIKAAYGPDELVTLNINGGEISLATNTTDPSGLINYNWTVPANALIGSYNVKIVSVNGTTKKSPADTQNFTIPGFPVNVTAKNLANETVESMTIRAYEDSTLTSEATTSSKGLAVLQLEIGNFTVKGYLKDTEVGEQTIQVNDTLTFDFTCNLTNVRIHLFAQVEGSEISIPDAGVYLTPYNKSFTTDINGTAILSSMLPNASFSLNFTRYDSSFNVTDVTNVLMNGNPAAWFDLNVTCPNFNLRINITKAGGQAFANARVKAQELVGAPLFEGTADTSGEIMFNSPFGEYRLQILDSNGVVLNETIVNLFTAENVTMRCDLFDITVTVRVLDYFGQGISGMTVKLQGNAQPTLSATTQGEGTATFDNVVGGTMEAAVYMGDSSTPVAAQGFVAETSPINVPIKINKYVVLAGMLVEADVLVTIALVALVVFVLLIVELVRRRRNKTAKNETESPNKES
jgi:hypothetical protein